MAESRFPSRPSGKFKMSLASTMVYLISVSLLLGAASGGSHSCSAPFEPA
jgi:hypothetical protein